MAENYVLIFFDVVGYTKNSETEQIKLFMGFQKELDRILYDEIMSTSHAAVFIPTGDGMIIGLKEDDIKPKKYQSAIEVISDIYKWSDECGVSLKCSIHVGSVNRLKDINRQYNIIGNTINNASRMLGGADNDSIIISKEFFYNYIRRGDYCVGDEFHLPNGCSIKLLDEDVVVDKHGESHNVFSVQLKTMDGFTCGGEGRILSKHDITVYTKEYPKLKIMNEKFFSIVRSGTDIHLIGIYHPNTPSILKNIRTSDSKTVDINLYYAPNALQEEIETFFNSRTGNLDFKKKEKSIREVKAWYEGFCGKENVNLQIYEYKTMPSFGASLVDIGIQGKGFIHVSNYVRGVIPQDTPYIELHWKTQRMSPLYRFYSTYIRKKFQETITLIFSSF